MPVFSTPSIGAYLREIREAAGLSQEKVAEAGGPYRQLQAEIEKDESRDLDEQATWLDKYDRAYRWPRGMTLAIARQIAELHTGPVAHDDPSSPSYAGVYAATAAGNRTRGAAVLGFDPDGDDPAARIYMRFEETVLTNVNLDALAPLAHARGGLTLIDAALDGITKWWGTDNETPVRLADFMAEAREEHPAGDVAAYQIGTNLPTHVFGEPVSIDPTRGLADLTTARRLAHALVALYDPSDPRSFNPLHIAHTLLALSACREGLAGITELASPGAGESRFEHYYRTVYFLPKHMGPDLAEPDRRVTTLLGGLLDARDRNTDMQLPWNADALPEEADPPAPTCTPPPTLLVDELLHADHLFVSYDSRISPELPAVITRGTVWDALNFYDARSRWHPRGYVAHPTAHLMPSFGVTEASDEKTLRAHSSTTATLTHWNGSAAIYCPAGENRAIRVRLPRQ